jgi:hypothetical protein
MCTNIWSTSLYGAVQFLGQDEGIVWHFAVTGKVMESLQSGEFAGTKELLRRASFLWNTNATQWNVYWEVDSCAATQEFQYFMVLKGSYRNQNSHPYPNADQSSP